MNRRGSTRKRLRAIPFFAVAGAMVFVSASALCLDEADLAHPVAPRLALDHVVLAVNDLDEVTAQYRAMGFSLKQGRPHANGIRNWHVKFRDGTEVELLTAPGARDDLTATYRKHLAEGDGPAFLALYPGPDEPAPTTPMPRYIFFSGLNHSPKDKPEHFAHTNSADSLVGVWVADPSLGDALTQALGLRSHTSLRPVTNALGWEGHTLALERSEVVLVPVERRVVKSRPIVGVVLRVKSLVQAEAVLRKASVAVRRVKDGEGLDHLLIAPDAAHGFWLDFVENWGLLAPTRPGER